MLSAVDKGGRTITQSDCELSTEHITDVGSPVDLDLGWTGLTIGQIDVFGSPDRETRWSVAPPFARVDPILRGHGSTR